MADKFCEIVAACF